MFLVVIAAMQCNISFAVVRDSDFERNLDRRIGEVRELVVKKDYLKISQLVDYMDKHIGDEPNFYVTMAEKFLVGTEWYADNDFWRSWSHVYQKAIKMDVAVYPYRLGQQIEILASRLRVAQNYNDELSIVADRKAMSEQMLSCWNKVLSYIDDSWDESSFEPNSMVKIPWEELKGGFATSGPYFFPPAECIENKEVREKYQKEVNAAKARIQQADLQRIAKKVRSEKKDGLIVKNFLVSVYSLQPFATSELEQLLKVNKVDETFAKEVLDAVRKAEKEAPPMTEFRNWETTDGLFKAKAKFVSSNGKTVTIEKENGKPVTLNLEDLRWSDKNVVKEKTKQ
jgi:hypothetical protein